MNYITEIIEKHFSDIDINSSDENANKLIMRLRVIHSPKNEKLTRDEAHSEDILKSLENSILKELSLKGISQIKKVYVKEAKRQYFDSNTGAYVSDKSKEWVIETDGTNLFEVFLLNEVDYTRTISNDINEIYTYLGIEAVRKALINELRNVLRPYDVYVNYRHIAILCDVMTQRGLLTAITRHGINRVELGPLRKCSFEETVEILLEAGLFSETDYLTGITENIMVGQLAPFGTGCFDLLLDINKILTAKTTEENKLDIEDELNMGTPLMGNSPSQTPFMNTPMLGNQTSYSMTPGRMRQMPNFTPIPEGARSPANFGMNKGNYIGNITTPNPYMMTPQNMNSPGQGEFVGYSPDDFENETNIHNSYYNYNSSLNNNIKSPISQGTGYSPVNSTIKTPFINSSYRDASPNHTSFHRINNSYHQTSSPSKIF
jgi:hypothetical protein